MTLELLCFFMYWQGCAGGSWHCLGLHGAVSKATMESLQGIDLSIDPNSFSHYAMSPNSSHPSTSPGCPARPHPKWQNRCLWVSVVSWLRLWSSQKIIWHKWKTFFQLYWLRNPLQCCGNTSKGEWRPWQAAGRGTIEYLSLILPSGPCP